MDIALFGGLWYYSIKGFGVAGSIKWEAMITACVGIIAELNPIHTGHIRLLRAAAEQGTVAVALSGNFVQRGDAAIAEKRLRALAALECGADIVVEIPVSYSMSTAQNFALGGVCALKAIGCDSLIFGSECGDIAALENAADRLGGADYSERLRAELAGGKTFAAARAAAAGEAGELLIHPNNNLAVEYIAAARSINAGFKLLTVKREGAAHDSDRVSDGFASASLLRRELLSGNTAFCEKYIPDKALKLLGPEHIADLRRAERAVLAVLRQKTPDSLKRLPDISEGIENKLFSAIAVAKSLDELYNTIKVKRYTHARIRRLVLSLFLGLDYELFMQPPPYVRLLGFNRRGEEHLRHMPLCGTVPVVTRVSEIRALGLPAERMLAAECRAADMFALTLPEPAVCGSEYTAKIIKTEC